MMFATGFWKPSGFFLGGKLRLNDLVCGMFTPCFVLGVVWRFFDIFLLFWDLFLFVFSELSFGKGCP